MRNKRGSLRYWIFGIIILFLALGVIAEESGINNAISSLSNETKTYVGKFVENSNISADQINSINQVDLNNPPKEVDIGKVENGSNIAIYEVNYTKKNESKKFFVVTYGGESVTAPEELQKPNSLAYLNFGENEQVNNSEYLKTATGVRSSDKAGYVMVDSGSITGVSTNLEITKADANGRIDIIVYKNGQDTGMRNLITTENTGIEKDYDSQSVGVVVFQPGDVISVYAETHGDVSLKNVINLVKIESEKK